MDCPHCFRRVVPRTDGKCPSCHQDTRVPPKGGEHLVALVVAETSVLPETCCRCCAWTRRKVRISSSRNECGRDVVRTQDDDGAPVAKMISKFVLGELFTRFWSAFGPGLVSGNGSGRLRVCVPMPYCADCATARRLEPVLVDYDYCTMRFAVHAKFAGEFKSLNPQPAR